MEGTSADGNNVACIYLFLFFPKGHFLLAGNSILCVHECACWRALRDSESKRRNRFILHSVEKLIWGWNRDLFNFAGSKPHVGRQCWQSNSTNFIFVLVHLKIISCRLNIRSRSHKCHTKSAKLHHWIVVKKKKQPVVFVVFHSFLPHTVTWPGLELFIQSEVYRKPSKLELSVQEVTALPACLHPNGGRRRWSLSCS